MVDKMKSKINIVCVVLVLILGIYCEDGDQLVASGDEQKTEKVVKVSQTCDSKDDGCQHSEDNVQRENVAEKDILEVEETDKSPPHVENQYVENKHVENKHVENKYVKDVEDASSNEINTEQKENDPLKNKVEEDLSKESSNEPNSQSDLPSDLTGEDLIQDNANKTSNSSGNSSALYQAFKYIMENFLEEFKDGIYSKPSEVSNVTDGNVSVPMLNETLEKEEANITTEVDTTPLNTTEVVNTTDTKKVKFHCTGRNVTDNSNATVTLITSARLLQLLAFDKNETENMTDCLLVMFYAPWCQFCARTAPHYNAVARAFPQLDFVAVDTAQFSNLLARFGTVSVPNILVFHQSRAAAKFNQTERTFENFLSFIQNATGLEPNRTVNVTELDYLGPVPSEPTDDTDYLLLISWIFVIFYSSCMFVKSHRGQQWITRVRILWQEHQHID